MNIHPIFKNNLTFLLVKTGEELRAKLADFLSSKDLVLPQKGILTYLRETGVSNQLSLCNALAINKATMVRFLDDLQNKGLITRRESKNDRREKLVKISKKGERVLEIIERKVLEIEAQASQNLTEEEIISLKELLLKFHALKEDNQ